MDRLPHEILGFIIGGIAWVARYLSLVLQESEVFSRSRMVMWVVVSWIVWILAIYIAHY